MTRGEKSYSTVNAHMSQLTVDVRINKSQFNLKVTSTLGEKMSLKSSCLFLLQSTCPLLLIIVSALSLQKSASMELAQIWNS